MNADKFTQKTIETIQTAQSMAQENGNQYLTPEHLLYALIDADGGLIGTLLGRMGVDCNAVLSELDTAINQLPKVSGGSGEVYASPETSKIFSFAEREAKSGGDAYVSVEHLMLGIFANETAAIKRIFSAHGITKAGFTAELKKVKTGPVTSDNPEDTYDALKKYGTDLVERAREGKMDPVIGRDQEIRNVIRILSRKTMLITQVKKFFQNLKAKNLKTFFLNQLVSTSKQLCHSSKKNWLTVLPTSQVVVSSKMYHVCSQMTWLLKLMKAKCQFFQFSKPLKNMVKSNMKKCLKSSTWVLVSCLRLNQKMLNVSKNFLTNLFMKSVVL